MTRLSTIRRPALCREVPLSQGRTVLVHALSSAQTLAINAALPEPFPPLRKDLEKGSLAPLKPDDKDPEYLREVGTVRTRRTVAETAVAMAIDLAEGDAPPDLFIPGEKPEQIRACREWIDRAVTALNEAFTEQELLTIWNVAMVLGGPEAVRGFMASLIVEFKPAKDGDGKIASGEKLIPENYHYTEDALLLRAAERFGQDPATWPQTLPVEKKLEYLAYERVRIHEEHLRDAETGKMNLMLEGLLAAVRR